MVQYFILVGLFFFIKSNSIVIDVDKD